jgi:DNA (cytosine-5)-methyltransferase 1
MELARMDAFAIDVCAGIGGLSLGLRWAGWDVLGVERDDRRAAVHRAQVGACVTADVRLWHPPRRARLVAGGVPCQPFSYAGLRDGTACDDGQLFRELLRVGREADADAVVMENVRGLTTADKGRAIAQVVGAFDASGYVTTCRVLNAAWYGVPQQRERVLIVGFRDPAAMARFAWPRATHGAGPGLRPYATVRQALGLRGQYAAQARLAHASSEAGGKARGWWQGGRAIDVDAPGYTVGTRNNADLLVPLDDVARAELAALRAASGRRREKHAERGYRLALPELARLQGFPPQFEFVGALEDQHCAVGNAVPPLLGLAIGGAVAAAIGLSLGAARTA